MKTKSARMKILLIVYILVLAVIIFIASQKGTRYVLNFVGNIPYGDKLGHFLLMGGFSFLLNLVLNAKTFGVGKFNYLLGSLIVVVVVTLEELSQKFVAGRTFDWGDLVFDYFGIFVFGELARFICQRKT
jgi:VanZ family protein